MATFAPSAVTLTAQEPVGSARNRWRTTVRSVAERDGVVRVRLHGEHELYADVTRGAATELTLVPGSVVWASVKATEVTTFGDLGRVDR
jgi:molybdate transport system ATP-binding protein